VTTTTVSRSSADRFTRRVALAGGTGGAALAASCGVGGSAVGTSGGGGTPAPPARLRAGSTLVFWSDQGGGLPAVMQDWSQRFQRETGVKVEATGGVADWNNKDELKEGSTTPVRISISTSPEYISPPPRGARVFADGQEVVVRDPVHTRWPDVERDVVNTVLNEQLSTGKATAAQATRQIKELGDPFFKS
jgi:hypothetical protein